MAFDSTRLAMVSSGYDGSGPRPWTYFTEDFLQDISSVLYFNPFVSEFRVGDTIRVNKTTGVVGSPMVFNLTVQEIIIGVGVPSQVVTAITNSGVWMQTTIPDISTAQSVWIGTVSKVSIVKASMVLGGTITGTDAIIRTSTVSGPIQDDVIIPTAGSAAGVTIFTLFEQGPEAIVSAGDRHEIETDGASTGAVPLYITYLGL